MTFPRIWIAWLLALVFGFAAPAQAMRGLAGLGTPLGAKSHRVNNPINFVDPSGLDWWLNGKCYDTVEEFDKALGAAAPGSIKLAELPGHGGGRSQNMGLIDEKTDINTNVIFYDEGKLKLFGSDGKEILGFHDRFINAIEDTGFVYFGGCHCSLLAQSFSKFKPKADVYGSTEELHYNETLDEPDLFSVGPGGRVTPGGVWNRYRDGEPKESIEGEVPDLKYARSRLK